VEGDEVIEAGTDIGLHTIRAASKVAPHGCIHGFDPLKSAILDTQRHIEMNKLHNITLNQLALGPNEGTGTIYSFPDMPRGHSCLKNLEGVTSLANDCLVTTIDQYVKSKFIKKIKLIKLDIEGSELPALLGASETITNFHPIVVAEVNFDTSAAFGYRPKDLIDFFNNFSYHCYIYRNRKWIELLREGDIKTGDNLLFIWKHDSSSLSTIK
jgi:FkbM family methyltransferase